MLSINDLSKKLGIFSCQKCGTNKKLTIDHIIPKSKNGHHSHISNLTILCKKCNSEKSNKMLDEFDEYYWLLQFIYDDTKLTENLKKYGNKFAMEMLKSAVGFKFSSDTLIHKNDFVKLNEYLKIYGVDIAGNIPARRMPLKSANAYVQKVNPNYVIQKPVLDSYIHHLSNYIS